MDRKLKIFYMTQPNKPIKKESEIQENPDEHIDQDFPGFPHLPATKKNITPETTIEKKSAAATKKRSKKPYG